MRRLFVLAISLLAGGCVAWPPPPTNIDLIGPPAAEVQILAINDFHGNLETPKDPVTIIAQGRALPPARYGGVVPLAVTLQRLRGQRIPHFETLTVSAGDLISASPLISAHYLDEPTVKAMNLVALDLNAVGNHEFDRGWQELLRLQNGGCEKTTTRVPCAIEKFDGARFRFLAENVLTARGDALLPGTALRSVAGRKIGFIGMTLKETATLVSPTAVEGLTFTDEAETANRAAAWLKGQGAEAVVLLIHQGGYVDNSYQADSCAGLNGYIVPIEKKLDPAINLIVSGHTHHAYVCQLDAGAGPRRLLTSGGKNGFMVSDIRLKFGTGGYAGAEAVNVPVESALTGAPAVEALVDRYAKAVAPIGERVVGMLPGAIRRDLNDVESPLPRFVADSMLAAAKPTGGDLALMNTTGTRVDLVPDVSGAIRYRQIFAMQPFNNKVLLLEMTGAQIGALLEQMFLENGKVRNGSRLVPSKGFTYRVDLARPFGRRLVGMRLGGKPLDPARTYRVATNNFLAAGGDGFSAFTAGKVVADLGLDLDVTEAWIRTRPAVPTDRRILGLDN